MTTTRPPPPPRPPSPTELSYTQLAKRAPPFGSAGGRRRAHHTAEPANDGGQHSAAVPRAPVSASAMPAAPSMAAVPRMVPMSAPPASISVPRIGNAPSFDTLGSAGAGHFVGQHGYQTPQTTQAYHRAQPTMPMSAPQRYAQMPMPQHQGLHLGDPIHDRATPVEDRVSNLELKLQAMQTPHHPSHTPSMSAQRCRSNRLEEMHQFIDTLKGMQAAVSRTENEQARVKKSRALHALLTMFENIIDEREARLAMDPSAEGVVDELQQRVGRLEEENGTLRGVCDEREGTVQQTGEELRRVQHDMQRLASENKKLKGELDDARRQCLEEQTRAREAQAVASESENVRDGLLANYARLTEENVTLQNNMHETNVEKEKMAAECESMRLEMSHLEGKCDDLAEQLQRKDYAIVELERKIGDLTDQLASSQNLLQIANNDRQRLQDELHASHRNSTAASEQLMRMRDQFSQFRREGGSRRQSHRPNETGHSLQSQFDKTSEAGHNGLHPSVVDEQRRRVLEMAMSKAKGLGVAAREETERVAPTHEEAKTTIDKMEANAQGAFDMADTVRDISSLNGANGTLSDQQGNGIAAAEVNATSPIPPSNAQRLPKVDSIDSPPTIPKVNEADSPLEYSSSSIGRRSQRSTAFDGFSLDELDDSIMNVRLGNSNDNTSAVSGTTSLLRGEAGGEEDAHPNLLDYFYDQIKLAE